MSETSLPKLCAIAQIATYPGQIKANTQKVISFIRRAKDLGAELVVFPELCLPSYGAMDLLFNRTYIQENIQALKEVAAESEGITVHIGFCDTDPNVLRPDGRPALFNSAAILRDGRLAAVQDKTLLPTYDIFDEARYFSPSRGIVVAKVGGISQGATICEDIWIEGYDRDPALDLAANGAALITNLSSSPFNLGKFDGRLKIVVDAARRSKRTILYANLVGAYDGFEGDVLFDGRSLAVCPDGRILGFAKAFAEDLLIVDLSGSQNLTPPALDEPTELYSALTLGIREYFHRLYGTYGRAPEKAIIGLSGGIDSAVIAALAADALGRERVLGVTLPSKYTSNETKGDAQLLARNLGIEFKTVSIEEQVSACERTLRADPDFKETSEGTAEENIQARLRMLDLMYYANKRNSIVLNTGNKTELALNNCTLYGDMVGGFSVLGDVDKDRVYALAEYINQRAGRDVIPRDTITRAPSAELKPNQTDAVVMGAMPQIIAPLVRDIIERGLSLPDALEKWSGQFDPKLIHSTFLKIDDAEYKRRQAAPAIRVTPHSFGVGRRVPMSHGFERETTAEESKKLARFPLQSAAQALGKKAG